MFDLKLLWLPCLIQQIFFHVDEDGTFANVLPVCWSLLVLDTQLVHPFSLFLSEQFVPEQIVHVHHLITRTHRLRVK